MNSVPLPSASYGVTKPIPSRRRTASGVAEFLILFALIGVGLLAAPVPAQKPVSAPPILLGAFAIFQVGPLPSAFEWLLYALIAASICISINGTLEAQGVSDISPGLARVVPVAHIAARETA